MGPTTRMPPPTWRCRACDTYTPATHRVCMVCAVPALVTQLLADIDLADTTRPGGVRARVEEAAALIHADIEAAHTGHPADVIPITTTANRSAAA